MRPLIGICCEFEEWHPRAGLDRSYLKLYHHYYHAVSRAGGLPIAIPTFEDPSLAIEALARCDGVLLTGGDDLRKSGAVSRPYHRASCLTAPWREAQDLLVAKYLLDASRVPVLAICMGHQVLAVAAGGSLVQDIASEVPSALEHRAGAFHPIDIVEDSRLAECDGPRVMVNSYHHQAVADASERFRVVARAPDGVVEAMEGVDPGRYLVGVQWHPERSQDGLTKRLFAGFVDAVGRSVVSKA